MEFISCYIMSPVSNSIGSGHTNTHTYRYPHQNNSKKLGVHWPSEPGMKMPAYTKSMNKTIKLF